jgi:hypothetical protein
MHILLPFFQWCNDTAVGAAIRNSRVLFPIIESIHLLALTVLLGTILVIDLRLMGAGLRKQALPFVARSLSPLTLWSLLTMLVTGFLLFASEAMKSYDSPPFRVKMVMLGLALLFHFTVFRVAVQSETRGRIRSLATAVASLTLWFGVAVSGRAIGFY